MVPNPDDPYKCCTGKDGACAKPTCDKATQIKDPEDGGKCCTKDGTSCKTPTCKEEDKKIINPADRGLCCMMDKDDKKKCEAKGGLTGGQIAGIVIGVILFLAGAGVGGYFLYKHLSKKKKGKKAGKSKTKA
jgi:hypothetical protein